jgi:hypothetical protein
MVVIVVVVSIPDSRVTRPDLPVTRPDSFVTRPDPSVTRPEKEIPAFAGMTIGVTRHGSPQLLIE